VELALYARLAIFAAVALTIPFLALFFAWLINSKRPNPIKLSTYECGLDTIGPTWIQFRVRYYLYALVFVVFDVETVFLYPWAVAYGQLGLFALMEMFIFIGLLAVGLAYAWRKGALEWK